MTRVEDRLTVYADYVCPFCYLGRRSLDTFREASDYEVEIDWHPYDLRSQTRGPDGELDHSVDDGKDEAYFDQVRENVERLKASYGAEEMRSIDDRPEHVDSLNAQLASMFVQREHPASWLDFDAAIYEALWVDGRDIGNVEVLIDVAETVGLDGDEIEACLADDDLREQLSTQFIAAQQAGITGVPTFVYDGYVARGAVPPEQLERLIEGS